MWKLTIEDDDGQRTTLELAQDDYSIGRDEAAAIRLTERNVSRTHASLRRSETGWTLEDQSSYNGTYVNGERVVDGADVLSGAVIHVGDYRIEIHEVAQAAEVAVDSEPRQRRPDRLVMVVGPTPGQEFTLEGDRITIGRAEEAGVSINHASVSRLHAEMVSLDDGRWEVLDQGSSNGIRVNGVDLPRGILEPGDALELGDVRLRFVAAGKYFRPSVDLSQQLPMVPFEAMSPAHSGPHTTMSGAQNFGRVAVVAAVLGVLVVAGLVMLRSPTNPTTGTAPDTSAKTSSDAQNTLDSAKKFAKDDLELAHRMLQRIPENSPVREDPAFTEIEDNWADAKFELVEKAKKKDEKLNILNLIIEMPTVSAAKRQRAADMALAIEPDRPRRRVIVPPRPGANGGSRATTRATTTTKPTAKTVPPAPAPAPPPPPPPDDGRFGSSAAKRSRDSLYGAVASGRASLGQMYALKAACVQLQDMACAQMALSKIKQKKAAGGKNK